MTDMRELTPDELENVAAGGVREIVAAAALAAMSVTGGAAFAESLDEHIAPPQEVTFEIGGGDEAEETVVLMDSTPAAAAMAGQSSINTGTAQNAGVWTKWDDINTKKANYSLPNGTAVEIIGEPQYNRAKGRNYVRISFEHKGKLKVGWVAASIVGMGR